MLVSFTASAGQNYGPDVLPYSLVPRAMPNADSALAEGPSMLVAATAFRLPGLELASTVKLAHLSFDDPERRIAIDPRQPRDDMKRSATGFPEVDRSAKGDPLPGLRPSISSDPKRELQRVVFGDTQPGLISAGFSPDAQSDSAALQGPQVGFQPYEIDEGLTDPALSDSSPHSPRRIITSPREAELHLESIDGSTPSVPTATAQTSTTPTVNYPVATLVAPPPAGAGVYAQRGGKEPAERATTRIAKVDPSARRNYLSLIPPADMARQQRCLAEAVYFEARSESEEGRAAVAQVVLNRVASGLYPDSVCGVVYQNSHRYLACQFTFTCEGKSLRITEPAPWRAAVRIAREVYDGTTYLAEVGGSTHYHANYVRPYWAKKLRKMDTIGQHVFYQLKPGQT
jgi:spore germination cell wall hydrolase CwlJ-like protein